MVNAWTRAGNPGHFLIDCFDAASLFVGREAEIIYADLDCAVACSEPKNSLTHSGTGAHIILGD